MSLTVKAFFKEEIRRINVDSTSASSYEYLEGKIRASFPNLPPKERLALKWKDSDGDLITFSTDDELMEALSSVNNGLLKVFLEKRHGGPWGKPGMEHPGFMPHLQGFVDQMSSGFGQMQFGEPIHQGVTCDNCEMVNIKGSRFKCDQCSDYDLCQGCKNQNIHTEHSFTEIKHPQWRFPHAPGMHKWGMGRKMGKGKRNCQESSDEEHKNKALMTPDMKRKMRDVVQLLKEAAKSKAYAIGGAPAGDCAGATVEIAVRSSIRRALLVQKNAGEKKQKDKKRDSSSSSSEDDSSEVEVVDKLKDMDKKSPKKQVKLVMKEMSSMTRKEVSERFGKLAATWAAQAVRQSMKVSLMRSIAANKKNSKQPKESSTVPEPMSVDHAVDTSPSGQAGAATAPMYPELGTFTVIPHPQPAPPGEPEQDEAITKAVKTFQDMGYQPDEWLMSKIIEKKGDIPQVFESIRPNQQQ